MPKQVPLTQLHIKLPEPTKAKLELVAHRAGVSTSLLTRKIIENWLANKHELEII